MNVLVVAAHPDDEVLGCSGTVARLAREGHSVFMMILGEGITARLPQPAKADPASLDKMRDCSRRVAHLLGVNELSLSDVFLDERV